MEACRLVILVYLFALRVTFCVCEISRLHRIVHVIAFRSFYVWEGGGEDIVSTINNYRFSRLSIMLCWTRLDLLGKLSRGGASTLTWTPHRTKHVHRLSRAALQSSRLRFQKQQRDTEMLQHVNKKHGVHIRALRKQRGCCEAAAQDLLCDRAHRQRTDKSFVYRPPSKRTEELATARQFLLMQEAARKEQKVARSQRTAEFRAMKRWR